MRKSLLLILSLIVASTVLLGGAPAQGSKRATTTNWLQYRRDNQRTGSNAVESQITPATAENLYLNKVVGFAYDPDLG